MQSSLTFSPLSFPTLSQHCSERLIKTGDPHQKAHFWQSDSMSISAEDTSGTHFWPEWTVDAVQQPAFSRVSPVWLSAASRGQSWRTWLLVKVFMCLCDHRYVPLVTDLLFHIAYPGRHVEHERESEGMPPRSPCHCQESACPSIEHGFWMIVACFFWIWAGWSIFGNNTPSDVTSSYGFVQY